MKSVEESNYCDITNFTTFNLNTAIQIASGVLVTEVAHEEIL